MIVETAPSATAVPPPPMAPSAGPERTCIVERTARPAGELVRFVVSPDGNVVPDLARRLPGRGVWVTARWAAVEEATRRGAFARAFRAAVTASDDLGSRIERLLLEGALADLGRARRAGRAVAGFTKAGEWVERGRAGLLVVPLAAAGDGLDKLAARAVPVARLGDEAALGGIFGRDAAVYCAVARDDAGGRFVERIAGAAARWRRYRDDVAG